MKNILLKTALVLIALVLSGAIYAQKKEKITITGKVTVKDTGKPPIGIITIAEKGVADYWANGGESIGTNHHTFVEKDGSYKFTINKGGTIIIQDGGNRYALLTIRNINESQTKDLILARTKSSKPYPNELYDFEKKIDIHKRIRISGRITDSDNVPYGNASILQRNVFGENMGHPAHTTSLKDGTYDYRVLKGTDILFGAEGYEHQIFTATKDTVINVKFRRANPFN